MNLGSDVSLSFSKSESWKFYPYRMLTVNWYVLFVGVLLLFAKVYELKFHLLFILLAPLILKFVFNAVYYGRFFIHEFRITENRIEIAYYEFGRSKTKTCLVSEINIRKKRSNTLTARYYIVLQFADNTMIRQHDFFGWEKENFDRLEML